MAAVTLGILAGGRGARLGGVDKAFLEFRGESLLDRTARELGHPRESGPEILLSRACEGVAAGALPGFRNVPDLRPGGLGPLAGVEALLAAAPTPWLLTLPVDLRDLPGDLVDRLRAGMDAPVARVVRDADGLQPLVALWPVHASLAAVRSALDAGCLSMHRLFDALAHAELDLRPLRLGNLNCEEDFATP